MDIFEKLKILTDAAKYDVACTSSGVDRNSGKDGLGSSVACGICHSFSADGRCISLLKILMSNACSYDCKYCVNRVSNDTPRATFTPREIAELTINFYRRNYIEGLFLSSGVIGNPTRTTQLMTEALRILREEYKFYGYIHAKAIPGSEEESLYQLGLFADRMSVNIEMPSENSLKALAPDKSKDSILKPMGFIRENISESKRALVKYRHAPKFVPAGQSTQMIVGASDETDLHILRLTEGLYNKYSLKRVFFSAYVPVLENALLPSLNTKPQLLREHRLYQADWLLRYYGFTSGEILDDKHPTFNPYMDPKCNWAVNNMDNFPIEINTAPYEILLRVPGIGVTSAKRIVAARRARGLTFESLKKLGVVLKRAQYFILCAGKTGEGLKITRDAVLCSLLSDSALTNFKKDTEAFQMSLFDWDKPQLNNKKLLEGAVTAEEMFKGITGEM